MEAYSPELHAQTVGWISASEWPKAFCLLSTDC